MRRLVLVLGACSYVPHPGAATDASELDASPDGLVQLGPWSAPVKIAELSGADSEDDPSLPDDMLEIFFGSTRPGGEGAEDIWTATRTAVDQPWSNIHPVAELSSIDTDTTIKVSSDGLAIMFASDRDTLGETDLYLATRPSRTSAWNAPVPVDSLNTFDFDYCGYPRADLLRVIFTSFRDGATNEELYVATRPSTDVGFGTARRLTEITTATTDSDPMEPDDHTLYFSTDRDGTLDIWTATRTGETYESPAKVDAVNGGASDRDPWVSRDQRTMVFTSDRDGTQDLFISTRSPL